MVRKANGVEAQAPERSTPLSPPVRPPAFIPPKPKAATPVPEPAKVMIAVPKETTPPEPKPPIARKTQPRADQWVRAIFAAAGFIAITSGIYLYVEAERVWENAKIKAAQALPRSLPVPHRAQEKTRAPASETDVLHLQAMAPEPSARVAEAPIPPAREIRIHSWSKEVAHNLLPQTLVLRHLFD